MKIISTHSPEFKAEWISFLEQDPVHPDRPINRRLTGDRDVFFLIGEAAKPLLILCVAYGERIFECVASIFADETTPEEKFKAATFYTVFRTKEQEEGMPAGQFLIEAVKLIKELHPTVHEFMTLSPIPSLVKNNVPQEPEKIFEFIQNRKDPVARFHLKNGATPYQIRFNADENPKRIEESAGIMINYDYTQLFG